MGSTGINYQTPGLIELSELGPPMRNPVGPRSTICGRSMENYCQEPENQLATCIS